MRKEKRRRGEARVTVDQDTGDAPGCIKNQPKPCIQREKKDMGSDAKIGGKKGKKKGLLKPKRLLSGGQTALTVKSAMKKMAKTQSGQGGKKAVWYTRKMI